MCRAPSARPPVFSLDLSRTPRYLIIEKCPSIRGKSKIADFAALPSPSEMPQRPRFGLVLDAERVGQTRYRDFAFVFVSLFASC